MARTTHFFAQTLRGTPLGGIKEKVLAARQAGIKIIVLPERNRNDLRDIPQVTRAELEFHFVENVRDATEIMLGDKSTPARTAARKNRVRKNL